ncbi:hypothetical protein E3N88_44151 [Mikania micrantha]|uniref:Uncharacterized protein n=1 Tax=Mikania micrantha TaxID=192012 RepID=A0A5N6LDG4_9ASTR|nr:hypothetical protein E3N88_44151 [Mikania micrantha]
MLTSLASLTNLGPTATPTLLIQVPDFYPHPNPPTSTPQNHTLVNVNGVLPKAMPFPPAPPSKRLTQTFPSPPTVAPTPHLNHSCTLLPTATTTPVLLGFMTTELHSSHHVTSDLQALSLHSPYDGTDDLINGDDSKEKGLDCYLIHESEAAPKPEIVELLQTTSKQRRSTQTRANVAEVFCEL